jgi:hypothetical protein
MSKKRSLSSSTKTIPVFGDETSVQLVKIGRILIIVFYIDLVSKIHPQITMKPYLY